MLTNCWVMCCPPGALRLVTLNSERQISPLAIHWSWKTTERLTKSRFGKRGGRPAPQNCAAEPLAGARPRVDPAVVPAAVAAKVAADDQATPLFSLEEAKEFRIRWDAIQGGFVDEPRRAVEQADGLVAGTMKRLAEIFADERTKLEGQLDRDESVSTENLRLALRRYRSFFGRLLSV